MNRRTCATLAGIALSIGGCRENPSPPPPVTEPVVAPPPAAPAPSAQAALLRGKPKGDAELPTTPGIAYVASLDAQITASENELKKDPKNPSTLRTLSGLHAVRGAQRGALDEIQRAIDLATQGIAIEPKDAGLYVLRASQRDVLRRYKESSADLAAAKRLSDTKPEDAALIVELEQRTDWNLGRYDAAIASMRSAAEKRRTADTLLVVADLDHALGADQAAASAYEAAEDLVTDKSPLVVAQINLHRGIAMLASGHLDEAVLFFREAVRRLPVLTAARERLASALLAIDQRDEATKLYEALLKAPEAPVVARAAARLAAIHRQQGRAKEADALKANALGRYEELLKKYPEATYEDAAEFFLGDGNNAARATELLAKNVDNRPQSESYTALARAQLATGDAKGARETIQKALAAPMESGALFWTAARIYTALGDNPKAASLAKRARTYNARIDRTEPPIKP